MNLISHVGVSMKINKHYFDWTDPKSQLIFQNTTGSFTIEDRFFKQTERLINNFELHIGDLILDYGCGIGKHAICLKKKGYNVIGYEVSEYYINKAKEIIEYEGLELDFHASNDFFNESHGRFDFIYTIDFPFYYLDEKEIDSLFCQINDLLKDSGKFLFGFPYTRENREHFLPRNKWEEKNGLLHLIDETLDEEGRRIERYIIIDLENETLTEWIDETKYYYLSEIQQFLIRSGFKMVDQFENLEKIIPDNAINVNYLFCEKTI